MFYVYELRDDSGRPFYVGKGSGRRMLDHKYKAKGGQQTPRADKIRSILASGGDIVAAIVFQTDDELAAFAEEKRLIAFYGRETLTNQTPGGGGIRDLGPASRAKIATSRRGRKASEDTKRRQREAKLGVPRSAETRAKISAYQKGSKHPWAKLPRSEEHRRKLATWTGRKHSPETIAKMKAAKRGHSVSEETRAKISKTKRGTVPWNKGRRTKRIPPDLGLHRGDSKHGPYSDV